MSMHYISKKVEFARIFATRAHSGQYRDDGKPYITHPMNVAMLLMQLTNDEEIICAALLHDVLEDCGISYSTLKAGFGKRVADLVKEVSRDKYKKFHIKTREGALIKLADTLHNMSDATMEKKASFIKRKIKMLNGESSQENRNEMIQFLDEHV